MLINGLCKSSLGVTGHVTKILQAKNRQKVDEFELGKLEAEAVEAVNFLWKRKRKHFDKKRLEAEANSGAKVLKRSWKRKHFFQNQALPDFQTGYNRWVQM